MSLAAGTQLGRYEIRLQLGAGGMGEVERRSHRREAGAFAQMLIAIVQPN